MNFKMSITLIVLALITISCHTQEKIPREEYPKALVSYIDYDKLVNRVRKVRSERLISFEELLKFQMDSNTVILDTRSQEKYNSKHLKGAVNLPFTEFTQANLLRLIPDPNTRIIIYCNNNFLGDPILFASKTFDPNMNGLKAIIKNKDSIMLPLNIPSYINLYGYGYRNIYELNELVNVNDPRLRLDGDNGFRRLQILYK